MKRNRDKPSIRPLKMCELESVNGGSTAKYFLTDDGGSVSHDNIRSTSTSTRGGEVSNSTHATEGRFM